MAESTIIYLSTGTNMGDRIENLEEATKALENQVGRLLDQSSVYETLPWGVED